MCARARCKLRTLQRDLDLIANLMYTVVVGNYATRPNVLGGRFVLRLKNFGTANELPKARYVSPGHRDLVKQFMMYNITPLRQSATRIIVSVAAIRNFRLFSHDVTQAYLQSDETRTRQVFLVPKKKYMEHFGILEGEILELLRPIYDMTDVGDYCGVTVENHARNVLGLLPLLGDPSLYIKHKDEDVDGMLGMCVDDEFLAGNKKYKTLQGKHWTKFESRPQEWENRFLGHTYRICRSKPIQNHARNLHPQVEAITSGCLASGFDPIGQHWLGLGTQGLMSSVQLTKQPK